MINSFKHSFKVNSIVFNSKTNINITLYYVEKSRTFNEITTSVLKQLYLIK